MKNYPHFPRIICTVAVLTLLAGSAVAGPRPIQGRYRPGVVYPRVGVHVKALPPRYSTVHHRRAPYFYFGGVWYHSSGPDFVVVAPPIGVIAPVLPPTCTTVWYQGVPYYYGNNTYYVWRPDRNGYMVVEPPEEMLSEQSTALASELYVYPAQGQSEEQRADDRFACHQWAVKETGYDPTQPAGNVTTAEREGRREDYSRAIRACLEGKGYSVR